MVGSEGMLGLQVVLAVGSVASAGERQRSWNGLAHRHRAIQS